MQKINHLEAADNEIKHFVKVFIQKSQEEEVQKADYMVKYVFNAILETLDPIILRITNVSR